MAAQLHNGALRGNALRGTGLDYFKARSLSLPLPLSLLHLSLSLPLAPSPSPPLPLFFFFIITGQPVLRDGVRTLSCTCGACPTVITVSETNCCLLLAQAHTDTAHVLEDLAHSLRVGLLLEETPRPARPPVLSHNLFRSSPRELPTSRARSRVEEPDSQPFSSIRVSLLNRLAPHVKLPARPPPHRDEDELFTSRSHLHGLHGQIEEDDRMIVIDTRRRVRVKGTWHLSPSLSPPLLPVSPLLLSSPFRPTYTPSLPPSRPLPRSLPLSPSLPLPLPLSFLAFLAIPELGTVR